MPFSKINTCKNCIKSIGNEVRQGLTLPMEKRPWVSRRRHSEVMIRNEPRALFGQREEEK